MTTRQYSSRSQQSTLTGAITSGATSMTVVSGTALLGGVTIPAGRTFTLVIDVDTALEEIVDATAVSTNTFTITRAIDGSTAQDHSAGAVVRHMAIGRDYRDANLHTQADASYNDGGGNAQSLHGIAAGEGVVVGTLKTQTLTNKTLTSPTISNPTFTGTPSAEASIVFEGATADAYETTLTVVDPTQDNTITLPNTTGTVTLNSATQTLTNKTLTSPVISGSPVITGLSSAGMISSSATPKDYVDSILGSATAAATSAASAATSAASAATSASSAATSASSALTSANSASTSATAAATSATSAAASATAAATSATSASNSALAASTSASSALTSANSASTSASSALTSANSASTSATASATSASAAATSATAAATSATSAAASATAAATSATSASASATAAATSATSAAASATAASTSASSASTSASSALTSANSAATSATAAATSETNAATSASSASTSASSALTSANSASTSASSAATSASSAAASFDSFDDRYLGPKASAPTVDNDGNPLTSGVLYYNTTSGVMFVYNGNTSAWEQVAVSTSGFPTLAGNNDFTGLNTFTNAGTADVFRITNTGTGYSLLVEDSTNPDSTPFIVDHLGRLILGNNGYPTAGSGSFLGNIVGTGSGYPLALYGMYASSIGSRVALHKSRSTTTGTYTTVNSGDTLGDLVFYGDDGTAWQQSAVIRANADATPSGGVVPGRLVFLTTDSAGTSAERMRISSSGSIGIGTTPTTATAFILGRNATGATTGYGMYVDQTIKSDVTGTYYGLRIAPTTEATTFNLTSLTHIAVGTTTIGASSTVGSQFGYLVQSTLTGATNNYGFYGNLAAASGVWNAYMNGTAANYFAGQTTVGSTSLTLGSGSVAQQFGVVSTAASNVGAVIRGAASQSGDLLQIQNSAGTNLTRIKSDGTLAVTPGIDSSITAVFAGTARAVRLGTTAGAAYVEGVDNTGIASYQPLYVGGSTLNLMTGGTSRASIDASGNVNVGTGTGGGTNTGGLSVNGEDVELFVIMGAWL